MARFLKVIFFAFFIKPIVFFWLGLNVFFKERLPTGGPAILVANHNSHLDTMVIMSLYPLRDIHKVRPVAAADYFLSNKLLAWFSLNVIGIIPIKRGRVNANNSMFDECHQALSDGHILLLFPEGSRGEPEQLSVLKRGVHHLIKTRTDINVVPIMMHGLGRALPKGEALLVPFNCDVVIGEPIPFIDDAKQYVQILSDTLNALLALCLTRHEIVSDEDE